VGGNWDYDCAIVGGGPGGLISALYLRRFRRRVVLINAGRPRAAWIPRTHNLIGYERGISGPLLLRRLRRQVSAMGGMDWYRAQASARRVRGGFEVDTVGESGGRSVIRARKLVIATGLRDRQPELGNLAQLRRAGLLRYCSICDGYEYRGQPLAVLARDDLGLQKALFIGHWTRDVRVLVPEELRVAPVRGRELARAGIRVVRCRTLTIDPGREPRRGAGAWVCSDGRTPFWCRTAYVELGADVPDGAFARLRGIRRSSDGYLLTTQEQRTGVPGAFAVGDCVNLLGQISVAAGQAAVAATAIHNDLLEELGD
jgi:thioredoxin reductase (NADPH)